MYCVLLRMSFCTISNFHCLWHAPHRTLANCSYSPTTMAKQINISSIDPTRIHPRIDTHVLQFTVICDIEVPIDSTIHLSITSTGLRFAGTCEIPLTNLDKRIT